MIGLRSLLEEEEEVGDLWVNHMGEGMDFLINIS